FPGPMSATTPSTTWMLPSARSADTPSKMTALVIVKVPGWVVMRVSFVGRGGSDGRDSNDDTVRSRQRRGTVGPVRGVSEFRFRSGSADRYTRSPVHLRGPCA